MNLKPFVKSHWYRYAAIVRSVRVSVPNWYFDTMELIFENCFLSVCSYSTLGN